jgi:hypothetical protein
MSLTMLERRALDDLGLRAGCSETDPVACCEPCWRRWVCARLLEHLRGDRYWDELDRGDYWLLRKRWHANFERVEKVVARVATGAESLRVLTWALETREPLDEVAAILRTLDVNARRLRRYPWLSATPPCGRA